MKRLALVIGAILLSCRVDADSPIPPDDFMFIIHSPSNDFYAVQTMQEWWRSEPADEHKSRMIIKYRFQVFSNTAGEMVWEADIGFGPRRSVFLADVDHIVTVSDYFWSEGWSVLPTGAYSGAPTNLPPEKIRQKLLATPAVTIYRHTNLVAQYTLGDLAVPLQSLRVSVSHASFVELDPTMHAWRWDMSPEQTYDIGELGGIYQNPDFRDGLMRLDCLDGKRRWFDYRTGNLTKTEPAPKWAARSDEFTAGPVVEDRKAKQIRQGTADPHGPTVSENVVQEK